MSAMDYRESNSCKWIGVRPAHNGTQIIATVESIGGGFDVIHTVTAGKVLHLCSVMAYLTNNVDGEWYIIIETDGEVAWAYPLGGQNITLAPDNCGVATFDPPMEIPANYVISVFSTVGVTVRGTIFGWEE